MSKRQLIILLGVWVMLFLFLGFPSWFDKLIGLATGLLIVVFAYSVRSRPPEPRADTMPYTEHRTPSAPIVMNDVIKPNSSDKK